MQPKEFQAKKKGQNIKDLAQRARASIKENRFDDALAIYDQILKQNPEAVAAYMGMGNVHMRCGRLDEAENYFKGALHVSKKVASAIDPAGGPGPEAGRHGQGAGIVSGGADGLIPNFSRRH